MLITSEVFHFEISGKELNEEHPKNKDCICVTFLVSQFEISGKDDKDWQPANIYLKMHWRFAILKYLAKISMIHMMRTCKQNQLL